MSRGPDAPVNSVPLHRPQSRRRLAAFSFLTWMLFLATHELIASKLIVVHTHASVPLYPGVENGPLVYRHDIGVGGMISRGRVTLNELGYPQRSLDRVAYSPACLRIAVAGDSFIVGDGVSDGQRFVDHLQRRVNRTFPDHCVQVFALAENGVGIASERLFVEHFEGYAQPDLTIIAPFENDLIDTVEVTPTARPTVPAGITTLNALPMLQGSIDFYGWIFKWFLYRTNLGGSFEGIASAALEANTHEARAAYEADLERLHQWHRARGIEWGMALMPSFLASLIGRPDCYGFFEGLADERGVPLVDTNPVFTGARDAWPWLIFDGHPNARGHRMIADVLFDWMFPMDRPSPFKVLRDRLPRRTAPTVPAGATAP
jgi:hypothetical protein